MSEKLKELLASIIGELRKIATTETIIGEPIGLGEKKAVPVSKISIGFGVGGGEGKSKENEEGFGGGGGGGARVTPMGFIVLDGEKVSFLPTRQGNINNLIELIPEVIDKVVKDKKQ